ncbi:MAG: hypothetical protein OXT67_07800 [Zetaproteobacteria bacterium]|nr:hypothetical protein [Zetaproteobacteria bacterium]
MNRFLYTFLLLQILSYTPEEAKARQAGLLAYGGLAWSTIAFHPVSESKLSPNYYSLTPEVAFGWSPKEWVSLQAWADYHAGMEGKTQIGGPENASVQSFGASLGFYIQKEINIELRGGRSVYNLVRPTEVENEVRGRWRGNIGGIRLLANIHKKRNNYVFFGLELRGGFLKPDIKPAETPTDEQVSRRLDQIRVVMIFMLKRKR